VSRSILVTGPVINNPQSSALMVTHGLTPVPRRDTLRGIANEMAVFEIP
jgi:hypothetical protein